MRPAGRGELESLYFEYPEFEPPPFDAVCDDSSLHDVLVVGAGPVGLATALGLARRGVRCVLFDDKATYNDGSRAICLSRSSMHALERMGVADTFLGKALPWRVGRNYFRGQAIGGFQLPHSADDKYLPMYNVQQQYIEKFLHEAAAASNLVEVRWRSAVVDVTQDDSAVTATIETPDGRYAVRARYVVAADGGRSPTRESLGLRLRGNNLEGRYIIADVRMDDVYATERHALFEPHSNPGGSVLLHRQPEGLWRVDYQLKYDEDADVMLREENIRARVGAILEEFGYDGDWDLEWWSIYVANTLCLDEYTHGRVVFAGDAAHIVPIFGVRGLNNGILDAENIAWKLARVLDGASPKLLGTYSPERRDATLDVFENTTKSAAFVTPPGPGHRLFRHAALSLALDDQTFTRLADPRNMTPYIHAPGPLTIVDEEGAFEGGPVAGSFCANVRLDDGTFVLDRMGSGYTAFLFSDDPRKAADLVTAGRTADRHFQVVRIPLSGSGDLEVYPHSDGIDPPAPTTDAPVSARSDQLTHTFDAREGTCYVLRPDQYVLGRWRNLDGSQLATLLL